MEILWTGGDFLLPVQPDKDDFEVYQLERFPKCEPLRKSFQDKYFDSNDFGEVGGDQTPQELDQQERDDHLDDGVFGFNTWEDAGDPNVFITTDPSIDPEASPTVFNQETDHLDESDHQDLPPSGVSENFTSPAPPEDFFSSTAESPAIPAWEFPFDDGETPDDSTFQFGDSNFQFGTTDSTLWNTDMTDIAPAMVPASSREPVSAGFQLWESEIPEAETYHTPEVANSPPSFPSPTTQSMLSELEQIGNSVRQQDPPTTQSIFPASDSTTSTVPHDMSATAPPSTTYVQALDLAMERMQSLTEVFAAEQDASPVEEENLPTDKASKRSTNVPERRSSKSLQPLFSQVQNNKESIFDSDFSTYKKDHDEAPESFQFSPHEDAFYPLNHHEESDNADVFAEAPFESEIWSFNQTYKTSLPENTTYSISYPPTSALIITPFHSNASVPWQRLEGAPPRCSSCSALLSPSSPTCFLCFQPLDSAEASTPKVEYYCYDESSNIGPDCSEDPPTFIFVIDTSGSMCITSPAKKTKIDPNLIEEEIPAFYFNDDEHERFELTPATKKKKIKHVERLAFIKCGVYRVIQSLLNRYPDARVCLITFNTDISILGPTSTTKVPESSFTEREQLLNIGRDYGLQLPPILEGREHLFSALKALKPSGSTAFGPAMAVAIGIASTAIHSRIIAVTDGPADVGLGALADLPPTSSAIKAAYQFYLELGAVAAKAGAIINLIGIQGTECQLDVIGSLAFLTGGRVASCGVDRVQRLLRRFVKEKLLGVDTRIHLHYPDFLQMIPEPFPYYQIISPHEIYLGSTTRSSAFGCSFEVNASVQSLPLGFSFPVQFEVISRDPSSAVVRVVLCQSVHAFNPRRLHVERSLNPVAVMQYAMLTASSLAIMGRYAESRLRLLSFKNQLLRICAENNLMQKYHSLIKDFFTSVDYFQLVIATAQNEELKHDILYLLDHPPLMKLERNPKKIRRTSDKIVYKLSIMRTSRI